MIFDIKNIILVLNGMIFIIEKNKNAY